MESTGAEKRIQALFSELSLADRRRLPRFEQLWMRAEATRPAPVRVFSRSLAVSAAVVILTAASSFALWTVRSQSVLNIAPLEIPTSASPQLASVVEPLRSPRVPRQKRIARPRQNERAVITEAALLSRWQSPTQSFMESPSSVGFNSLPQLNQSAKDLESFLKESNQ